MKHYKSNYKVIRQNVNPQSFECMENPQINECYKNNYSFCHKKPKKIIVTEIYDEIVPRNRNCRKKQENFNYYTQSSSPFYNRQYFPNMSQSNVFSRNNYYLTEKKTDENCNSYMDMYNKKLSDYNKQLYFGRTDLREEYSPTSNERVDIRKKVCRGSTPPYLYRNGYNLDTNDENFVENFQYYESKNIKDKSNKKYDSITRVTGYSNLIPLRKNKLQHNYTTLNIHRNVDNFNNISSSRFQQFQQLQRNYSNIDVNKNNNSLFSFKDTNTELKKPQSEEKITTVEVKKTTEIYENKRKHQLKPEETPKKTNVQTVTKKTNVQTTTKNTNIQNNLKNINKPTSVTKYEPKKAKPEEKKITNVYVQKKIETKYEVQKKPQNTPKITNVSKVSSVQNTNTTKKYETYKKVENTAKAANVSTVQSQNITKKYDASKNLQNTSKKSTTNISVQKNTDKNTQKNNFTKIKIDTSKYTNNNTRGEKLYFKRGHGGYTYKESLSEQDVLNARKTGKSVNTNRVEVVQKNKVKEEKNKISNSNNKSNINSITSKVTSYKRVENTSKGLLNNKSTSNINNISKATSNSKVNNISKVNNTSKITTVSKVTNTSNVGNTSNTNNTGNNKGRTKESATLVKKTVNISSNISNKGKNDNNIIKKSMTNTKTSTNIKTTNLNNNSSKNNQTAINNANKDYNIKKTQVETFQKKEYIKKSNTDNQKKDLSHNQYSKTNINKESQTTDIINQYNNNIKKIVDDSNMGRNMGYIEKMEIYETEQKGKRETTPKLRVKVLGDNYKYYEGKYIPSPGEITTSYTLHQRRNERVIYGTEEIGGTEDRTSFKMSPHLKGYKSKKKKIVKRTMMPIQGAPNKYIDYADYYEGNYRYGGGDECNEYEEYYENEVDEPHFYYQ